MTFTWQDRYAWLLGLALLVCLTAAGCANRQAPQAEPVPAPTAVVLPTATATPEPIAEPTPVAEPAEASADTAPAGGVDEPRPTAEPNALFDPPPTPASIPEPTPPAYAFWNGRARIRNGDGQVGRVVLERNDGMVYARLRVPLADVSNSQPQTPAYRVHIPESFRPGHAIRQSTNGNPIDGDARASTELNATFDVQIDPEGALGFSVWSEGSVGNAAGLWVEARLVWPLLGTPPRVCERNIYVQQGIMGAVRRQGHGSVACDDVTWQHLSSIRKFQIGMRYGHEWELHGLTGLKALDLFCNYDSKEHINLRDILALMPNLEKLSYRCPFFDEWPLRELGSAPNLVELNVDAYALVDLPPGWLDSQPRLTNLTLAAPNLSTAAAWLVAVPGLRSLELHVGNLEALTVDWLQHTPRLTRLHLSGMGWSPLPGRWLAHAPGLVELGLAYPENASPWFGSASPISADLLAHTPNLTRLRFSNVIEQLPAGGFDRTQVRELTLYSRQAKTYPAGFRMPASLTHLDMHTPYLQAVPDGFLAHAPNLTHLELSLSTAPALNDDFLSDAPRLQDLTIRGAGGGHFERQIALASLPTDFLSDVPSLERLYLGYAAVTEWPPLFLHDAPRLTSVIINATDVEVLPERFLEHAPRLDWLVLHAGIEEMPDGVLEYLPAVEYLWLEFPRLRRFSDRFLRQTPKLKNLQVYAPELAEPLPRGSRVSTLLKRHSTLSHVGPDGADVYDGPPLWGGVHMATLPPGTELEVRKLETVEDGSEWLRILMSTSCGDGRAIAWMLVDQAEPSLLYTSTVWHRWETPKYPRPCPGWG